MSNGSFPAPIPPLRDYQRELMEIYRPIDLTRSLRTKLFLNRQSLGPVFDLQIGDIVDLSDRPDLLGFDPGPRIEYSGRFIITGCYGTTMRGPRKSRGWRRHVRNMKAKSK